MSSLDIIFYIFVFVVLIQVIFYIIFLVRFALIKPKKETPKNIAVSVLICAKNEAENLQHFLPSIINQKYPNFEIVLINDASSDDTLQIMESFAAKHNNIKIVNVKSTEAFWGNKKYAITLGIKASKHSFLLLTDADCEPVSKYWISQMSSHFSNTKSIVLGYGAYSKIKKSLINKLIRFETLLTAIQYFSYARLGMPYMGVGRNLAYRKEEFFKINGFMNHMNIRSGDDDLFINQIATAKNTNVCYSKNSFTMSIPKSRFKDWYRQKTRHVSTATYYKLKHKILLAAFYVSQLFFWLLAVILLIILFHWKVVLALILFRMAFQIIALGISAKKLNERDIIPLLPVLELFLIVVQLPIFISNLISKPNHWK